MNRILMICPILLCLSASAQDAKSSYTAYNRSTEVVKEGTKTILRMSEAAKSGVAWIDGTEFSAGIIEFDARGRDVMQKSFLGIAFHGIDNNTYETVYFRPFNFQSADPNRKIHAVQYAFEPKFDFQQLRNTAKDKYEAAIVPANIRPDEWFHVKIEVKTDKISVYLNENKEYCLQVIPLNTKPTGKKIGFWVGNNSNGDFSNFRISKD